MSKGTLRRKGLVLAMEDDNGEMPVSNEEMSENIMEMSDDVHEMGEMADEIQEYDEAMDSTEKDIDTMDQIQDVMEKSVEDGEGLDETSAEVVEIAIESIRQRLGITKKSMPSLESFGSAASRNTATRIAIENVKEFKTAAWKAIRDAFMRVKAHIEDFLKKYFTSLGHAKTALDALEKQIKDFNKSEKSETEISNKSLASTIAVGGKADANSLMTILKNQTELTNNISIQAVALFIKMGDELTKPQGTGVFEANEKLIQLGIDYEATLIGQSSLKIVEEKLTESGKEKIAKLVMGSGNTVVEKLPVLSKDEMMKLVKEAQGLLIVADNFSKHKSKIDGAFNAYFKAFDILIKGGQKVAEADKETIEMGNELRKTASNARTLMNTLITKVPSMDIQAIKATMQYVTASMKMYS